MGIFFLQQLIAPQSLFKHQSGRVIALGRVMLATLFLLAIWFDSSEPVTSVAGTYLLLILYALLAIAIAVATWRNWWLDARLAIVTHGLDMAVFTAIVFSTNGSTSPFFLFFVLPLLSAAIRWSWRETALTAAALSLFHTIDASAMILMWNIGTALLFAGIAAVFGPSTMGWVASRMN